MTLTGSIIGAVCESLLNPAGRFRTLRNIAPYTDSTGRPRFTVTSCTVDFEVHIDGVPHLLKIPFGPGAEKFRSSAEKAAFFRPDRVPFIAPWHYHKDEMLAFTGRGAPAKSDVLTEAVPQGLPLRSFIRSNLHSGGLASIRELLSAFASLYASMDSTSTIHGHIRADNLTVHEDGLLLGGYIHTHDRSGAHDTEALLTLAVLSYTTACVPSLFPYLWRPMSSEKRRSLWQSLKIESQFDRNDCLLEAVEALSDSHAPDSLHAANLLRGMAAAPFSAMSLLEGLLADDRDMPATDRAHDVTFTYTSREESSFRTDLAKCEYVGAVSENVVRYRKAGKWGFADSWGGRIGKAEFTAAGDFYEGRAAVATAQGAGLLGKDGNYVMPPVYEALEWYGPDNVAAACRDGVWHLYDRTGKQLTLHGYEWIAEPSEGLMVVKRGNKFGYISTCGQPITQMRFDEAFSFSDATALVEAGGEIYRIDREGRKAP